VAGLAAAFGSGAMTNSLEEIERSECIFLIGSNPTENHPLVVTRIYRAKARGAKLIIADPRKIQLSAIADLQVRQILGTDVALLNGMMQVILARGWADQEFIQEKTESFEELKKALENYPPERVAEITGIPPAEIVSMAQFYATAKAATILYAMGITQHTTGVDNVLSLANLAMLTGHVGKESTGVNPLRGQNNVQGACDMGGLPDFYPGYQSVTAEAVREKFEAAWGVQLSNRAGLTSTEIFPAILAGQIKGLVIMGENPVVSEPDCLNVSKALQSVDFLVVIDIFKTPTAELAEVILPGVSFAEKDGTFTNTERRVQRIRKAFEPQGGARPEWQVLQDLSQRFGYPMKYHSPLEIMEEVARLTPIYGGVHYDRLDRGGLCWPCPDAHHPGTKILHQGMFSRGRGRFHRVDYRPPAEIPDPDYPFFLTTGRVFAQYHTGTMSRSSPTLAKELNECFLELNPMDAAGLEIKDGQMVSVESRRGIVKSRVRITDRVSQGMVFMPFHFLESRANVLTNPVFDPVAKIPEYKVCAVRVAKAE
jgi:formate dehydrogenase alpha subunit